MEEPLGYLLKPAKDYYIEDNLNSDMTMEEVEANWLTLSDEQRKKYQDMALHNAAQVSEKVFPGNPNPSVRDLIEHLAEQELNTRDAKRRKIENRIGKTDKVSDGEIISYLHDENEKLKQDLLNKIKELDVATGKTTEPAKEAVCECEGEKKEGECEEKKECPEQKEGESAEKKDDGKWCRFM